MDEVEAFERSNRFARRVKVALVIAIALSPVAYVMWRFYKANALIAEHEREAREAEMLSDAEVAQLRTSLAQATKAVQQARAEFVADVTPATLAAVTVSDARCSARPDLESDIVEPGQPIKPIGLSTWLIEDVQEHLDKGEATKTELRQIEDIRNGPDEVLLVVGKSEKAVVMADSYLPGHISGNAYVYSYRARRIVCAAEIDVQNKEAVDIQYTYMEGNILDEDEKKRESGVSELERDLQEQLRAQIAARLRATENGTSSVTPR
jgi:hypothetical protein